MKKQEFLVWRYVFVEGADNLSMKYVGRVSGYLYGLEMVNENQLPIGIYRVEKNARKQWRVVDLLTGLLWDSDVDDTKTLDSAYKLIADRCVKYAFDVLKRQESNVLRENKALYDRLMCLGEFSRPLRLTPLRLENMPQSCITYDSDGLRSQA